MEAKNGNEKWKQKMEAKRLKGNCYQYWKE